MKITLKQLKQIIKEEITSSPAFGVESGRGDVEDKLEQVREYVVEKEGTLEDIEGLSSNSKFLINKLVNKYKILAPIKTDMVRSNRSFNDYLMILGELEKSLSNDFGDLSYINWDLGFLDLGEEHLTLE